MGDYFATEQKRQFMNICTFPLTPVQGEIFNLVAKKRNMENRKEEEKKKKLDDAVTKRIQTRIWQGMVLK